jgi:endonuclease/exonuclease/phosphatase (EEP) superfamily protein YafD
MAQTVVTKNIQFNTIEKDLEVCALRMSLFQKNLIIICIYRSTTGDFKYFINQLEIILNRIYKAKTYIFLCGDFNINHFEANNRHNQLQTLLASYNLISTVTFPTRITSNTSTLTDNIYVNVGSCNYKVSPLNNSLSDHDAQIMEILNFYHDNPNKHHEFIRKMDNNTILNFINLLSYENWSEVFLDEDVTPSM